jgi:AraC-like DNA-binding protein
MDIAFPPLTISPLGSGAFHACYRSAGTEHLQISDMSASAHLVQRHPGVASARSFDYFKISLQLSGSGVLTQANRELRLEPGSIAVYDTARSYDLRFEEDFRFVVGMFPKSALEIPEGIAGDFAAYPLDANTGPGSMLVAYLTGLVTNLDQFSGPSGDRLAQVGLSLITSLLANEIDGSPRIRRSLLVDGCYYINEKLADPTLTPESIAAAHFISTRQLYKIFEDAGVSVSKWIKHRRITECRRDLVNSGLMDWSIAQIGARWAFGDGGYFSRVFKESFGISPREWRAQGLGASH